MIEQILLASGTFDGVREIGGFGQPLHALYPQIRAVLAGELEPDAGFLLAEPVVDRTKNRIDWYVQGDPDYKPAALSELPDEQRRTILARIDDLLGRGRDLAERYAASGDTRRAQLGAILRAVLATPAEAEIFLVEGKPAITGWGFAPDRPWETPDGSVRRPPPVEPAKPMRDVVVPEVAVPESSAADSNSAPPAESSVEPVQPAEPSPPPLPEPVMEPPEPRSESPAVASGDPAPPRIEAPPLAEPEPAPVATVAESPPAPGSSPAFSLRYVVVGSRYFWSVAVVALLLVLFAAYWGLGTKRSPRPVVGETAHSAADAKLDGALSQARRDEAALRDRLEQLLVQLAQRRGQCASPTGADAGVVVPVPGRAEAAATSPTASADRKFPPIPGKNDIAGRIPSVSPGHETLSPVDPGGSESRGQESTEPASTADPETIPTAPQERKSDAPTEATAAPSVPQRVTLPLATQSPSASTANPLEVAGPPPTADPASHIGSGVVPPRGTLEDALTERDPEPAVPPRRKAPVEPPPIKAELTPEERQEFADRMTETGATTGEITATLLWNSQSDLDLVVRCPSGRQLDYRNPAECGGALDVDANTARGNLSGRPVENVFWPAGKAEPGVYEVMVRYVPRKDEERPRETPFQVRLIRGGQESVFKGMIRPNAVVPVTTFAVQR